MSPNAMSAIRINISLSFSLFKYLLDQNQLA
jgi:hypothetical protein